MSSAPATTAKDCPICDGDERWSSPYCPHWSTVVAGISRTQPRHEQQSKAEALADYDSRMAAAVAGVAAVNPKQEGAPAASTSLETLPVRKRKKRRSKEEMAEVRADEADRIRRIRRRVTPDWLQGQDEDEAAFVREVYSE